MRGLFYSQYVKLSELPVMSLSICQKLVQEMEIDFLYGSPAVRSLLNIPRFSCLQMPSYDLQDREANAKRIDYMKREVKPPYDFLMTEQFPFGKIFLREEVLFLREWLKSQNPACRFFCSLPDIVEIQKPSLREKALKLFSDEYDALFFHSDPTLIMMEDTFPEIAPFKDKVFYTGFVPNSLEPSPPGDRQKRILVPIIGEFLGENFVRALLPVMSHFPEYEFVFILPRNTPPFLEEILQTWSKRDARTAMRILPYQRSLEGLLRTSALSICLADSHLIDLVDTRTPGIAFAANSNQELRLKRFAEQGLVKMMSLLDLKAERLQKRIEEALAAPYPDHQIDTKGAEHTLELLMKFFVK